MGKKNKKSKSFSVESDSGMQRNVRRELLEICGSLLEKCSIPFGSRNSEWSDYLEVYNIVEKLRKKQQNYVLVRGKRDDNMEGFLNWVKANGVDVTSVFLEKYDDTGYGLKAAKDLEESEMCLSIPQALMMTTETAHASILGPLIEGDRILQSMPNVVMVLHVLCEYAQPSSFWQPYLKILPEKYNIPLYFTPDDLQQLKGSPLLNDCLNQFRSITRQYAYFFKIFQGHPDASKLPIKNFCYDDYRWAAATIMTRQNEVPLCGIRPEPLPVDLLQNEGSGQERGAGEETQGVVRMDGERPSSELKENLVTEEKISENITEQRVDNDVNEMKQNDVQSETCKTGELKFTEKCQLGSKVLDDEPKKETNGSALSGGDCVESETIRKETASGRKQAALIPMWDMCNHINGHVTTDFNVNTNSCECYTLSRHKKGEQIFIFYGPRSNAELLLHSGFIYDDNNHDRMAVKLGLSKNDSLYGLKAEVLARVLPNQSQVFFFHSNPDSPIDGDTLAYLRVFSLDKDTLFGFLVGDKSESRRQALKQLDCPISRENETRAWSFLEARAQLLLRAYPTTEEEDTKLLLDGTLAANAQLSVQLRRCEKRILRTVAQYANQRLCLASHLSDEPPPTLVQLSEEASEGGATLEEGRNNFDQTVRSCYPAMVASNNTQCEEL